MYYTARYASPLGSILLACEGKNLVGLWYEGQKYFAATIQDASAKKAELTLFADAAQWLDAYFAGHKPDISALPLAPAGSDFRKAVWDILCEIPYGTCTTYGNISAMLAARLHKKSMSSQAVGGAVGHNPISIIIPCHRVVGSNGSLTGYAGGFAKKIQLLEREGVDMARFFIPATGTAL